MKIGLALGAGAARGMCHLGVIKALIENNIKIDCIAGSSMGAMVGGVYAAGVSVGDMEKMSLSAKQTFVMDLNMDLRHRQGLFQAKRVSKLLQGMLGDLRVEECPTKFCATAVDVETGELVIFKEGVFLRDAIRASIAIPAIFTPWEIDGRTYIDGGVLCRLPIQSAREMGADAVIAVDAIGPLRRTNIPKNFVTMFERYTEIADWEITKAKINNADILITPDMGDKSMFIFKDNDAAAEAGYNAAMAVMPQISELSESKLKRLQV